MRISACYIVKNEESVLARSLESLKDAVDEIIVVDTGSTDKTKEIAQYYTDKVESFVWTDDFAAARNYALAKAQGDWIIFLDADEAFASPSQVRPAIDEYITQFPYWEAVEVRLQHLDDDGIAAMGSSYHIRVFRNSPAIRYAGRIHEMLQKQEGKLSIGYADERLEVMHTGYAAGILGEKLLRNLKSLQADIRENGKVPAHAYYLADCYFGLQDFSKALKYATEALLDDLFVLGGGGSFIISLSNLCGSCNFP